MFGCHVRFLNLGVDFLDRARVKGASLPPLPSIVMLFDHFSNGGKFLFHQNRTGGKKFLSPTPKIRGVYTIVRES